MATVATVSSRPSWPHAATCQRVDPAPAGDPRCCAVEAPATVDPHRLQGCRAWQEAREDDARSSLAGARLREPRLSEWAVAEQQVADEPVVLQPHQRSRETTRGKLLDHRSGGDEVGRRATRLDGAEHPVETGVGDRVQVLQRNKVGTVGAQRCGERGSRRCRERSPLGRSSLVLGRLHVGRASSRAMCSATTDATRSGSRSRRPVSGIDRDEHHVLRHVEGHLGELGADVAVVPGDDHLDRHSGSARLRKPDRTCHVRSVQAYSVCAVELSPSHLVLAGDVFRRQALDPRQDPGPHAMGDR